MDKQAAKELLAELVTLPDYFWDYLKIVHPELVLELSLALLPKPEPVLYQRRFGNGPWEDCSKGSYEVYRDRKPANSGTRRLFAVEDDRCVTIMNKPVGPPSVSYREGRIS